MSTVEKLNNNQVKLTIEVSKELFEEAIKAVYPEVSKDTKVDGFRPGKVPMNIFISRFGYGPLFEEAVNYSINKTYPEAVEENKLYVVNQPTIDIDFATLSKENGFTYTIDGTLVGSENSKTLGFQLLKDNNEIQFLIYGEGNQLEELINSYGENDDTK